MKIRDWKLTRRASLAAAFVTAAGVTAIFAWAQDAPADPPASQRASRFTYVDVYVDSGQSPLAAYQFELSVSKGEITIVGVEGGEHAAFAEPPYYDTAALQSDRIIIAAFDTGDDLPSGRSRVARIHLMVSTLAPPPYRVELTAAADSDGRRIDAKITLEEGE